MSEGNGMMTYVTLHDSRAVSGVPGVAMRLGIALEKWAAAAAEREARRTPSTPVGADARAAHDVRVFRAF
jgi:hypothetical protein